MADRGPLAIRCCVQPGATPLQAAGDPAVFTVVQEVQDYLDDPATLAEVKAEHQRRFDLGVIHTEGRPKPQPSPAAATTAAAATAPTASGPTNAAACAGDGAASSASSLPRAAADDDGSIDAADLRALTLEASATCGAAARDGNGDGDASGGEGGEGDKEPLLRLRWTSPDSGMFWGGFTVGLVVRQPRRFCDTCDICTRGRFPRAPITDAPPATRRHPPCVCVCDTTQAAATYRTQ